MRITHKLLSPNQILFRITDHGAKKVANSNQQQLEMAVLIKYIKNITNTKKVL